MAEQNADGTIIVDSELNSEGFKAGSNEIKKAVNSLKSKVEQLGPTFKKALSGNASAISAFNEKASALEAKISEIKAKMDALGQQRIPTEGYQALTKDLDTAEKTLLRVLDRQEKMEATGVKENSKAWRALQFDLENAYAQYNRVESAMKHMESSGTAFQLGSDTAEFKQYAADVEAATSKLADMKTQVAGASNGTSGFAKVAQGAGAALKTLGKTVKTIGKGFMTLGKWISSAVSRLGLFRKRASGSGGVVKKLAKSINGLWSVLKRLAIRKLMMAIITSVKQGFENLAQYSKQTNTDLSSLKSGLTRLKNSFATAFAPILTAVTPLLKMLIGYTSEAITKVGMFFAVLTGQKTFIKAIDVQEDYAASLNETADAAKNAGKALAGFDELNNTNSQKDTTAGDAPVSEMFEEVEIDSKVTRFFDRIKEIFTSGDYEQLGEIVAEKVNSIIQKINNALSWDTVGEKATQIITGITSTFNSLVTSTDWALIGDTVAQGLNTITNAIHLFLTGVDWGSLGTQLFTGINGFIEGVDWAKIGQTIAAAFQSALNFLYSAVTTFDFIGLGSAVAESINNAFASIDWGKAGKTLSDGVIGVLNSVTTLLKKTDWQQVGKDIAEFLTNIDWGGVISALFEALNAALGAVVDIIKELPGDLKTVAAGFLAWKISSQLMSDLKYIFNLPPTITFGVTLAITGIAIEASAIKDAIQTELDGINFTEIVLGGLVGTGGAALLGSGLATWIESAFAGSAVDLAITQAGINMGAGTVGAAGAAMGASVLGIIAGIPAMFVGIYDACVNEIDWLNSALTAAGGAAAGAGIGAIIGMCGGPIGAGIGALIGLAVGLVTDGIILIVQKWDEISAFFSNFFTVTIPNMWNAFVNWITQTVPAWFASIPDKIGQFFTDLWRPIKEFDWKGLGYNIGQWFGNAVKDAINFVTVTLPNWLKDVWETITSSLKTFFTVTLPKFFTETLPEAFKAVWEFIKQIPKKIWDAIKSGWNWLVDTGKAIIDGIWEGLQTVWKAIKDFVSGFVQGFKDALGIHSPSTIFAEIGQFLIQGLLNGISAAWSAITTFFSNAIEGLKTFFSNAWSSIKNTASAAWNGIKGVVSGAWDGIKSGVSTACSALGSAVSGAWNGIKSGASTAWSAVSNTVSNAWGNIKTGVSSASSAVGTTMSNAWSSIKSAASSAWSNISSTVSSAWSGIKSGVSSACSAVGTTMSNAWNGIKSATSTAWSAVSGAVSGAWTGIKSGVSTACSSVSGAITGAWNGIKSGASTAWTNVKNTVSSAWSGIKSGVSSACSTVSSTVSSAWNSIKSGASTAWTNVKNTVSSAWNSMKSTASSIGSSISSNVSSAWNSIKNTVSDKVTSLKNSISTGFNNAKSAVSTALSNIGNSASNTFSNLKSNATTWGKDICDNIGSGIRNAANTVGNAVKGVADKIKSFLGFSEPEDGPLSDFHTYMPDMIDLMAYGIRKNQGVAINAVSDLAEAISDKAQNSEAILPIDTETGLTSGIDGVLSNFADRVSNSFTNLVNRLTAIANGVRFTVPAVAMGTVLPYSVAGGYSHVPKPTHYGNDDNNPEDPRSYGSVIQAIKDLERKFDEVVDAIDNKETGITEAAIYGSVKRSANKESKATGRSPF